MNTLSAAITPTRDDYSLPILNENQNRGDMDSHPLGARVRPVSMHRRFFTAAIITVLTAGVGWGVLLLWHLAAGGSFTVGIPIHQINAHGHAQIFGWVVLFIMGFAYEIFPRIWRAGPVNPNIAQAVFVSMLVGVLLSIIGIASPHFSASYWLALAGGVIEVIACSAFATQIMRALLRGRAKADPGTPRLDPSTGFIIAALTWLVIMSIYSAWHTLAVMSAASNEEALLAQVRTWQSALRDTQVHGLALFMILGVSIRLFPGMFGLPQVTPRRGWIALTLLAVAVTLECTLLITSQTTGIFAIATGLLVPWLMLPIGVALIIWPWKLWRQVRFPDRSAKFVRIAYGWLFVSFAMLLFLPVYQWLLDTPFSHAYYGAARHAITVGFVSMMIIGISSKMVPGFRGMNILALPGLWIPFVLINLGCLLRVSLQIASDWTPIAYSFIGFSGVVELAGLAVWAAHLIHVMWIAPKKNQAPARQRLPFAMSRSSH